jgi:uncharacterized membrane protein
MPDPYLCSYVIGALSVLAMLVAMWRREREWPSGEVFILALAIVIVWPVALSVLVGAGLLSLFREDSQ